MHTTLQLIHSYWAYLALLIIILATINGLLGLFSNRNFGAKDLRISLFALIVTHLQVVLGLILYIISTSGIGVDHPIVMIIAVILITVGFSKHKKKEESKSKFKTITIFYTIALLLILSRIPWSQWF